MFIMASALVQDIFIKNVGEFHWGIQMMDKIK